MQAITSDDLYRHRHLQDLSGSVLHSRVVFVMSRPDRRKGYRSGAWLIDTGEAAGRARRLTSPAFNASSLLVDAKGERMAFLSSRDPDKGAQVHVIALDGGEARAVTDTPDGIETVLAWSADGDRVLAVQSGKWKEDAGADPDADDRPIVVRYLPWKMDGSGVKAGKRTRLVAIAVTGGEWLRWSRSIRASNACARKASPTARGWAATASRMGATRARGSRREATSSRRRS